MHTLKSSNPGNFRCGTQRGDGELGTDLDHGSVGHKFALSLDAEELREVLMELGLPYLLALLCASWLLYSSSCLASRPGRLPW